MSANSAVTVLRSPSIASYAKPLKRDRQRELAIERAGDAHNLFGFSGHHQSLSNRGAREVSWKAL
jgi:hypothetical protein